MASPTALRKNTTMAFDRSREASLIAAPIAEKRRPAATMYRAARGRSVREEGPDKAVDATRDRRFRPQALRERLKLR